MLLAALLLIGFARGDSFCNIALAMVAALKYDATFRSLANQRVESRGI